MNTKFQIILVCCAVFFCITTALGSIERNFWGIVPSTTTLIDPGLGGGVSPGRWDGSTTSYSTGITYTATTATTANTRTAETIIPFTATCSGGFSKIKEKNPQPLSIANTDTCKRWLGWIGIKPTSQEEYKMQYDTLRHYVESCGKNDDSYHAFSGMDGAVQEYAPNDTTRYDRYRDWLISVLYLNTTQPFYFCACIESIGNTYEYGKYALPNATDAVLNYLRSLPACDDAGLERQFKLDTAARHHNWLQKRLFGGDTTIKEDTTLPSLDKIGLGFLLKGGVTPSNGSILWGQYLASFTSNPNPFNNETTLQFTLNRMTYTIIVVYDELGRLIWGDGRGSSLEAGEHTIHLDASNFPSGTLYARISTGFGEVKTVKLVHEK